MARYGQELEAADIGVFVVGFDEFLKLRDLRDRLESPFVFLRDAPRSAYLAFGLGRASALRTYLHPNVLGSYARLGFNGHFPRLSKNQDRRQLGGDFVVHRTGEIAFSHPERGTEDRAPVRTIIAAALAAQGG